MGLQSGRLHFVGTDREWSHNRHRRREDWKAL
jgi:hypothetical protein